MWINISWAPVFGRTNLAFLNFTLHTWKPKDFNSIDLFKWQDSRVVTRRHDFLSGPSSANSVPGSLSEPTEGQEPSLHQADLVHPVQLPVTNRNQCQAKADRWTRDQPCGAFIEAGSQFALEHFFINSTSPFRIYNGRTLMSLWKLFKPSAIVFTSH